VLGFETYASALKDLIESSHPQFSIGIFGGWGSGKTTLMQAIKIKLDNQIVPVWFNAWRYEKEEHLIIPLLDTLRDALVTWAEDTGAESSIDAAVQDSAVKAASTIAKAARAIFMGIAVKATLPLVEASLDASKTVAEWRGSEKDKQDAKSPQSPYYASFKALQESLSEFIQHGKRRIVVFIDDLDRCLPANALQILESMKLFFDFEGFVFVVGLDQEIIEASIDWNYRFSSNLETRPGPQITGTEYIKKLFQVPFRMPAVSSGQLDDFLTAIFSGAGDKDEERDGLLARIRPHLDFLVGDSGLNPREVKRYINAYILQKSIQPDLDDDVTLVLQTIAFRDDWKVAYQVFRSKRDAFTEAAKRQLGGEEDALKRLDSRLETLPESFYRYIDSKGGKKLLSLDAPQIEEQVRSFDITQPPESQLSALEQRLANVAEVLDVFNPVDPRDNQEIVNDLRTEIKDFERKLQESGMLRNRSRGAVKETMDIVRSLKDSIDALGFTLRRGDDMQAEDFDKFLQLRREVTEKIEVVRSLLAMLAGEGGEVA